MIEFKDVSVTYSSTGVDALHDINLKINDGDFVFVVGESGAGKSTLIKLLQKEIDATSGQIDVNGFNLTKMRRGKIPNLRRTIGVVFQDYRLIPTMTVYENVAFVMRCVDAPKKYIKTRVPYVIGLVGLSDKADCLPEQLSGGEQQRVALARALVNDPKLIIADEPTANVDPALTYGIFELLKGINACGTTVIVVTHDLNNVVHFGGRIIRLDKGNITIDQVFGGAEG
ncbi:MAG: cell division ATP-binding protein FtsE [Oscillospiraceae bacterium]|nr:cell division ATP-binding protein FtsE [Oscillospiraceae bacterium]MBQ8884310.1 cell division ATP-binding protein FtsE [Oscillospiraceae bacterium]